MNITDVKILLKELITKRVPVTPMLWGQHGIGKSACVAQVAEELGYRILVLTLSQRESTDLIGLPVAVEDPKLKLTTTVNAPADWFGQALVHGNLILFCDEFNQARREVLAAAHELILDRGLNNRRLPDTVFILTAGNPPDERYDVTELSESMRDRLMHIKVEPDVPTWVSWAKGAGIDQSVVTFLQVTPKAAWSQDKRDDKFPVEIRHSLRSWERVSTVARLNLPSTIKFECFRGIVGPDLATAYIASQTSHQPLTADQILKSDPTVERMLVQWSQPGKQRIDLLTASIGNLITSDLDTAHAPVVLDFIAKLPGDVLSLAIAQLNDIEGWAPKILKHKTLRSRLEEVRAIGKAAQQAAAK